MVVVNQAFTIARGDLHITREVLVEGITPVKLEESLFKIEAASPQDGKVALVMAVMSDDFKVALIVDDIRTVMPASGFMDAIPGFDEQAEIVTVFQTRLSIDPIPAPRKNLALTIRFMHKAQNFKTGGNGCKNLGLIFGFPESRRDAFIEDLPVVLLHVTKPNINAPIEEILRCFEFETELKFGFDVININGGVR